jgi:murein DD-endopeptidase MepM/ murein hydrolase activator NlpD
MKISNLALFVFLSMISVLIVSRDHCSYPNESVSKFCRKSIGNSVTEAVRICTIEKLFDMLFDWPIELSDFWVSSLFGPRTHKGATKHHGGVDLAAITGTAVKASSHGKVIRSHGDAPGYGNVVEILHKGGLVTRYGHLHDILVREGDKVKRGDMIGTVGSTGNVRGQKDASHLHFEIIKDGQRVDPLKHLYCSGVAFQKS